MRLNGTFLVLLPKRARLFYAPMLSLYVFSLTWTSFVNMLFVWIFMALKLRTFSNSNTISRGWDNESLFHPTHSLPVTKHEKKIISDDAVKNSKTGVADHLLWKARRQKKIPKRNSSCSTTGAQLMANKWKSRRGSPTTKPSSARVRARVQHSA